VVAPPGGDFYWLTQYSAKNVSEQPLLKESNHAVFGNEAVSPARPLNAVVPSVQPLQSAGAATPSIVEPVHATAAAGRGPRRVRAA
jgi:hypothetical protein